MRWIALSSVLLVIFCAPSTLTVTQTEAFRDLVQVTSSESDEYQPSVSADGAAMVYTSDISGNGDIYMKSPPWSKSTTQMTFHSAPDRYPALSSDGSRVAFSSLRNGNWDIFYANVGKGFAKTQVTSSIADEIAPSFSPDGKKIVYMQKSVYDSHWYIWIADLDAGSFTQLGEGMYPKWSPDNKKIVYQKASETGERYFNIWIYDTEKQTETQVLSGEERWGAINPYFSPGGKKIVFAASKMKFFGTKVQTKSKMNPGCLLVPAIGVGGAIGQILGGGTGLLIGLGGGLVMGGLMALMMPSPEITLIDPIEFKELTGTDVYVVNIDGSGLTQITSHESFDWYPSWSGDNRIYFNSLRSGNIDIWSIRGQ